MGRLACVGIVGIESMLGMGIGKHRVVGELPVKEERLERTARLSASDCHSRRSLCPASGVRILSYT